MGTEERFLSLESTQKRPIERGRFSVVVGLSGMKEVHREVGRSVVGVLGEAAGAFCFLMMVSKVIVEWICRNQLRDEMVKSIYRTRVEDREER